MAHNATNFQHAMMQSWEAANPTFTTDATKRAPSYKARRLEDFWDRSAFFIHKPGDDPSGVWQFPDESIALIGDSGNWVKSFATLRALERRFPRS